MMRLKLTLVGKRALWYQKICTRFVGITYADISCQFKFNEMFVIAGRYSSLYWCHQSKWYWASKSLTPENSSISVVPPFGISIEIISAKILRTLFWQRFTDSFHEIFNVMVLGICVQTFSFILLQFDKFRDKLKVHDKAISILEWEVKLAIWCVMTTRLDDYICVCQLKYVANNNLVIVLIHPRKEGNKTIKFCYYYFYSWNVKKFKWWMPRYESMLTTYKMRISNLSVTWFPHFVVHGIDEVVIHVSQGVHVSVTGSQEIVWGPSTE